MVEPKLASSRGPLNSRLTSCPIQVWGMQSLPQAIFSQITRLLVRQEAARAALVCKGWASAFRPLLADLRILCQMPASVQLTTSGPSGVRRMLPDDPVKVNTEPSWAQQLRLLVTFKDEHRGGFVVSPVYCILVAQQSTQQPVSRHGLELLSNSLHVGKRSKHLAPTKQGGGKNRSSKQPTNSGVVGTLTRRPCVVQCMIF